MDKERVFLSAKDFIISFYLRKIATPSLKKWTIMLHVFAFTSPFFYLPETLMQRYRYIFKIMMSHFSVNWTNNFWSKYFLSHFDQSSNLLLLIYPLKISESCSGGKDGKDGTHA